jgi:2-methylcitrate dehydratase
VLDALGCAIGAYQAPGRKIMEETAIEIGGPKEATCFGSGLRTSALNASLVNAFLVRFLDYSDMGGGGHNSDGISSILAVAERQKSNGRDFLTSVVISYELGARFKDALDALILEERGWTTDMRCAFNQCPSIGKLMKLSEEQIANAIGVCMSHTIPMGILDSNKDENVMAKNIRFGWSSHDAILACLWAKKGFTGPIRILESEERGLQKVLVGDMDLQKMTDFSGWRILKTQFKTVAANGTSHPHILSTLGIVIENDLKPGDIAEVNIGAPKRESRHTTSPPKKYPRNAESADHSTFFMNAMAIKERCVWEDAVNPKNFTDPVVLDLIEKMTVHNDPSLARYQGASEIITKDGRRFYKRIDDPPGVGTVPLSDVELEDKFRRMARRYMGKAQIDKLVGTLWNLEKLKSVGELTKLMVFPRSGKR